jgi:hypothetical protein
MKTVKQEEMRNEYKRQDLGKGIRGKHFDDYGKGTNLVLLSPDVAAVFPDDVSVNDALRSLMKIARQPAAGPRKHSTVSRLVSRPR